MKQFTAAEKIAREYAISRHEELFRQIEAAQQAANERMAPMSITTPLTDAMIAAHRTLDLMRYEYALDFKTLAPGTVSLPCDLYDADGTPKPRH